MGILTDPWNLALAGACAGAYAWARRAKRAEPFPTELWYDDPPMTDEGTFQIGSYVPIGDPEEFCLWRPWDGGEQHLAIFGTTNAGKTVTGKLLSAAAPENWGWHTVAMDFAKDGLDFAYMDDSGFGEVVRGEDAGVRLGQIADLAEQRGKEFGKIRVRRRDRRGIERAVVPANLRALTPRERAFFNIQPMLVVIDELAYGLAAEKARPAPPRAKAGQEAIPRHPLHDALLKLTTAGRYAGIHLVCIMQRGDADLLSGFIGNLLRARVLIGSTDQTAENMAHGAASLNVWRDLMGAEGWEPDGMERALRPPGRAFVSGLERRLPGLVQLGRFDADSRFMTVDEWRSQGGTFPDDPPSPPPPDNPPGPGGPSGGSSSPPLSLVPDVVRTADYADRAPALAPERIPGSAATGPRLRVV